MAFITCNLEKKNFAILYNSFGFQQTQTEGIKMSQNKNPGFFNVSYSCWGTT